MTSLHELQELFYQAVFEPGQNNALVDEISEHINTSPGLSATDHFKIYRDSVTATLERALREIYPVCCRLVGEQFFNAMGLEYSRTQPSYSADLAEYGASFADFISAFGPAAELPYLPDVARLELAWHLAFHSKDEADLDIEALSNVSEQEQGKIVFQLPCSAELIVSEYPIHRIWQVNQSDYTGDDQINLDEGGVKVLVWRQGYTMRIDPLEHSEWRLLTAIQGGNNFHTICTTIPGLEGDPDIVGILPMLVQRGWISGFRLSP